MWDVRSKPPEGFQVLSWETESFVCGSLWDIGCDLGYTPEGFSAVSGQVWKAEAPELEKKLHEMIGDHTFPIKTKAILKELDETIPVTVFCLKEVKPSFIRLYNTWILKKWSPLH